MSGRRHTKYNTTAHRTLNGNLLWNLIRNRHHPIVEIKYGTMNKICTKATTMTTTATEFTKVAVAAAVAVGYVWRRTDTFVHANRNSYIAHDGCWLYVCMSECLCAMYLCSFVYELKVLSRTFFARSYIQILALHVNDAQYIDGDSHKYINRYCRVWMADMCASK